MGWVDFGTIVWLSNYTFYSKIGFESPNVLLPTIDSWNCLKMPWGIPRRISGESPHEPHLLGNRLARTNNRTIKLKIAQKFPILSQSLTFEHTLFLWPPPPFPLRIFRYPSCFGDFFSHFAPKLLQLSIYTKRLKNNSDRPVENQF